MGIDFVRSKLASRSTDHPGLVKTSQIQAHGLERDNQQLRQEQIPFIKLQNGAIQLVAKLLTGLLKM